MRNRAVVLGVLGWLLPSLAALPVAAGRESAGGEAALGGLLVWWALATVGCFVAGLLIAVDSRARPLESGAFGRGLVGVAAAWIATISVGALVEANVSVLHLGGVPSLVPIAFVVAYAVGFGLVALLARAGGP